MDFDPLPVHYYHAAQAQQPQLTMSTKTTTTTTTTEAATTTPCTATFTDDIGDAISLLDVLGEYPLEETIPTRYYHDADPAGSEVFQWTDENCHNREGGNANFQNRHNYEGPPAMVQQESSSNDDTNDLVEFLSFALQTPHSLSSPSELASPCASDMPPPLPPSSSVMKDSFHSRKRIVSDYDYDDVQQQHPCHKRPRATVDNMNSRVPEYSEHLNYNAPQDMNPEEGEGGDSAIPPTTTVVSDFGREFLPVVAPHPATILHRRCDPQESEASMVSTIVVPEATVSHPEEPTKSVNTTNHVVNNDHDGIVDGIDETKEDEEKKKEEEVITPSSFSEFQIDRWDERFKELIQYKEIHGHCCVPNAKSKSKFFQLSQWVKRQRYQYRLKQSGKFSTLTDDRKKVLDRLGFVWDIHSTTWEERLSDLYTFRNHHGHCKVPIRYPQNPELAIWAKCQRRHYREYCTCIKSGNIWKSNTMTKERIMKLKQVGFVFSNR